MGLDKVRKEEEELEAMMYPSENPSEEALVEEEESTTSIDPTDFNEDEEDVTDQEDDGEESSESDKKRRTSWKQRYSTYKGSTDATLYQLRQRQASLEQDNARLAQMVNDLQDVKNSKRDLFEGVITAEDEDLIGTEAVGIMKKATEAANKPLLEEISRLRSERLADTQRRADEAKASSTAELRLRLSDLVKNFETIDMSRGFSDYLNGTDDYSGHPRKKLYGTAVTSGDVYRVADFYNKYAESLPPTKESILGKKVGPTGQGGASSNSAMLNGKKVYSINEYTQTYTDYSKKAYRNKDEKNKLIEKMAILDQAYIEGRVV